MKIAIVNGPNLKYIGKRETNIYGDKSLDDLPSYIAQELNLGREISITTFQSNSEGQLIDFLEKLWESKGNGIVINAGAYTHTSIALADCLRWISIPYVEIHLSNVYARESFRHKSLLAPKALGVICGFGIYSYVLGVRALLNYLNEKI